MGLLVYVPILEERGTGIEGIKSSKENVGIEKNGVIFRFLI